MDCPPSLGLMTFNAITASDYVIIPLVAEILPFNGLKMISDFIGQLKKYLNPKLKYWVFSSHDGNQPISARVSRSVFAIIWEKNIHDENSQERDYRPSTIGSYQHS